MFDFASLFDFLAAIALVVVPPILLIRMLADGEGDPAAALFAFRTDPAWPRGVQEEDPPRWRVELIETGPLAEVPNSVVRPRDRNPRQADCLPRTTAVA